MSTSRVSFVPSTILTTSSAALAGSNGAVTFLNKPVAGQPSTLSSTGSFKMALPRSSTSGQGSSLQSINVNYSIEDSNINAVTVSLSTQSFGPDSVVTAVPTTPSGFTLTPGNYTGVVSVNTPSYANGADPEYYLLDVTVVVDTSVITELRINDVELVYQENAGGSFPSDVNIPGYLNVGSVGPPANTNPGDITGVRAFIGDGSGGEGSAEKTLIVSSTDTLTGVSNLASFFRANDIGGNTSIRGVSTRSRYTGSTTNTAPFSTLAFQSTAEHAGTGSVQQIIGAAFGAEITNTAFANTAAGATSIYVNMPLSLSTTGGTITTSRGIWVRSSSINATTVVEQYGIEINDTVATSTRSVGIRLNTITGGASNYGLWFSSNNTGTGTGIVFGAGGDTSMWRGSVNQLLTQGDWMTRHYLCSSVPTVAAGAGAGTSPTISITGTDHGFTVSLTTGTTATANAVLFIVTFGATWTLSAPAVTWSAGNSSTSTLFGVASKAPYIGSVSTTTMVLTSNTTALSDSTAYIFRFTCMR